MLKIKNVLILVLLVVCFIGIGSVLFEKCSGPNIVAFKAQMDSLNKVNDSLKLSIAKDDAAIDSLNHVDGILSDKLAHQKTKVITITNWVDSSKNVVDTYTEQELVSSFYKRYPTDTVTNPLPVAQPVLIFAAKDLVELDGAKQIIIVKDSSIATLETKVSLKDTVISKYVSKEINYKKIMTNQYNQIQGWEDQYGKLEIQYNKLKVKSKFQRIGSYVVIGGLAYLMLAK